MCGLAVVVEYEDVGDLGDGPFFEGFVVGVREVGVAGLGVLEDHGEAVGEVVGEAFGGVVGAVGEAEDAGDGLFEIGEALEDFVYLGLGDFGVEF